MGVYTRFKREPEGFRALVELLETTPLEKRKHMIDVGMAEDPEFTQRALSYVMTFEDLVHLPDPELAELVAAAPPRITAYALSNADKMIRDRFLHCAKAPVAVAIRDYFDTRLGLREIGGAKLKLVETARKLEKAGFIRTKRIPLMPSND